MTQPGSRAATERERSGPILVATDATSASEPALRAARALAEHTGAEVQVISVLEPIAPLPPLVGGVELPQHLDSDRSDSLRQAVEAQVRDTVGSAEWPVTVVQGHPAAVIARTASRAGARMIVMGIGRHEVSDRLFGDETALRVLRLADVPVFAVTPAFNALPRRALVAVDFSPSSLLAARVALGLVSGKATLQLAHVAPQVKPLLAPWERFGATDEQHDYTGALRKMKDELDAGPDITVDTVELRGHPAQTLLEHARKTNADLIVCGSHGFGFLQRMFVGSVATRLLRGSTKPVLVVPQSFVAAREAEAAGAKTSRLVQQVEKSDWASRLKEFTARNAARRCMVEVDDPSFGAQLQVVDYPLLGVAYDHHDDRVEIMLGDQDGGNHLTKSITGVTGIDLVQGPDGRDRVLRIAHGSGQTLLTVA